MLSKQKKKKDKKPFELSTGRANERTTSPWKRS